MRINNVSDKCKTIVISAQELLNVSSNKQLKYVRKI